MLLRSAACTTLTPASDDLSLPSILLRVVIPEMARRLAARDGVRGDLWDRLGALVGADIHIVLEHETGRLQFSGEVHEVHDSTLFTRDGQFLVIERDATALLIEVLVPA